MKTEYLIDGKKLIVRPPNAVEALLLWDDILKKVNVSGNNSMNSFTAHCIGVLKDHIDLKDFNLSFEDSLKDEKFFQEYKEIADEFVGKMLIFFKKKE